MKFLLLWLSICAAAASFDYCKDAGVYTVMFQKELTLRGPSGAKKYMWMFERQGGKFDTIGETGNCSLCSKFEGREETCNQTLLITKMTPGDSGCYKLRSRFKKGNSSITYFKVQVIHFGPVLVPLALSKYSIALKCVDPFAPPKTIQFVFIWGETWYRKKPTIIIRRGTNTMTTVTQMNDWMHGAFYAACCSFFEWNKERWCGPTAEIRHLDGDLCTNEVPARNWCPKWQGDNTNWKLHFGLKGGTTFQEIDTWYNPLSTCKKTNTGPGTSTACVGHPFTLKSTLETSSNWNERGSPCNHTHVHKIGGNGTCTDDRYSYCNSNLKINSVAWSGNTFQSRIGNLTNQFSVKPKTKLGVNLAILSLEPSGIKLKCVYRTTEQVTVKWFITGIYEKAQAENDVMKIDLDCWYSHTYWQFKGGVRCEVQTETWKGVSSTFTFEAFRTGNYCGGGGLSA